MSPDIAAIRPNQSKKTSRNGENFSPIKAGTKYGCQSSVDLEIRWGITVGTIPSASKNYANLGKLRHWWRSKYENSDQRTLLLGAILKISRIYIINELDSVSFDRSSSPLWWSRYQAECVWYEDNDKQKESGKSEHLLLIWTKSRRSLSRVHKLESNCNSINGPWRLKMSTKEAAMMSFPARFQKRSAILTHRLIACLMSIFILDWFP